MVKHFIFLRGGVQPSEPHSMRFRDAGVGEIGLRPGFSLRKRGQLRIWMERGSKFFEHFQVAFNNDCYLFKVGQEQHFKEHLLYQAT